MRLTNLNYSIAHLIKTDENTKNFFFVFSVNKSNENFITDKFEFNLYDFFAKELHLQFKDTNDFDGSINTFTSDEIVADKRTYIGNYIASIDLNDESLEPHSAIFSLNMSISSSSYVDMSYFENIYLIDADKFISILNINKKKIDDLEKNKKNLKDEIAIFREKMLIKYNRDLDMVKYLNDYRFGYLDKP